MRAEVAKDTMFPPQGMIAVRLTSARMVYWEAAVERISHLFEELKKPLFDLLVAWVDDGEHVFFELLQFPGSIPEFRVRGRDT